MSLDFFDSLELIQGIQTKEATSHQTNQFSLEITENENLQKLFPFKSSNKTVKIEWRQSKDSEDGPMPGKALIHFNPNLCYNVIDKMIKASNLEEPKEGDANSQKDISRSGHFHISFYIVQNHIFRGQTSGYSLFLFRFYHRLPVQVFPSDQNLVLMARPVVLLG